MTRFRHALWIVCSVLCVLSLLCGCAQPAPAEPNTPAELPNEGNEPSPVPDPEPEQVSTPARESSPEIVKLPTRLISFSAPDGSVISVTDAINESYCVPFGKEENAPRHYYAFDFRVPTITGKQTETIDRLNEKLAQIMDRKIGPVTVRDIYDQVKKTHAENGVLDPEKIHFAVPLLDYECVCDPYASGALAIRETLRLGFMESEYDTYCHFYYYDVASDRELDLDEYLSKNGKDLDTILASFLASPEGAYVLENYYGPGDTIQKEEVVGVLCRPSGVCTLYCSSNVYTHGIYYWDYIG